MSGKSGKLILLIDDDKLVLDTVTRLLEKAGHEVIAFQSSTEAIREAMLEDFDMVISDIRMPDINGIQTIKYLRELRAKQGKDQMPEILVTGYMSDYGSEAEKLKPHALIHKPFNLSEFMDVINNILK